MIDPVSLWKDYELLDSGLGQKLERYSGYTLVRPDPQAIWNRRLDRPAWESADAWFERTGKNGLWHFRKPVPEDWTVWFQDLVFRVKPTSFKHTGLFPEQAANWLWMAERLKPRENAEVLNLFAYTGGATLMAARSGARVTHVDASKGALKWARENMERSGLSDRPVRWIHEDVQSFVARELRRGRRYDAIVMDPPPYGRGTTGELWKIETHLSELMDQCRRLMSDRPIFFLVSSYASGYSHISFRNFLESFFGAEGEIESGDLVIPEAGSGRRLPCGVFSRWRVDD